MGMMLNLDDTIRAFVCCTKIPPDCKNCPEQGPGFGIECRNDVKASVLRWLKEQEPLLMNFSDIQTMSIVDVYLEDRGSDLVYPLMLLGAENSNKSQTVFFHPMTVKPLSAYGKTWRCWTSRPDEKRRAETPWE